MNGELEKKYRLSKLFGFTFILSVFVYGVVLFTILRTRPELGGTILVPLPGTIAALTGFCLVPLVAIRWIKPLILKQTAAGPIESRLLIADLVAYALCEMPSFIGFVAALTYRHLHVFMIPAVLSLISYVIVFPKAHQWEAAANAKPSLN